MTDTAEVALASEETKNDQLPWKVVTHHYPDPDALACLWGAVREVVKTDLYQICFIPAGTALPTEDAAGFRILTLDTGKGEFDQHHKNLERSSSFDLFCKKQGLVGDPGYDAIRELTIMADNIEVDKIDPTSVYHVLKGLAHYNRNPTDKKSVDWGGVCDTSFIIFDILCSQARMRVKSKKELAERGRLKILLNGIRVMSLLNAPHLRSAAFEAGADVVVWTAYQKGPLKGHHYVGVQATPKAKLKLDRVMACLRIAEAKRRDIPAAGFDLRQMGELPHFGGWFLHESLNLILCGTPKHELEPHECSKLSHLIIFDLVCKHLAEHPMPAAETAAA